MSLLRNTLAALVLCSQALGCGAVEPEETAPQVAATAQALNTPNILQNSNFKLVGPSGSFTSVTTAAAGGAGNSAAASWTLFTNTPGTITTSLSASSRPGSLNNMIRVRTNGDRNGLVQVFGAYGSGYTHAIGSAWVYVIAGAVGIGTGNGGGTGIDKVVTTKGAWVYVQALNGGIPANEFIIYSVGGAAEFLVDTATVQNTPNLLQNQIFQSVGPSGSSTSATTVVPGGAGNSAAASWTLFTNTPGLVTTALVPSTFPGTTKMIHVQTAGDRNGLVQVFAPFNSGPAKANVEAYVKVQSGKVGIGAGNGGNTNISAQSTLLNTWQQLKGANLNTPANEFIIYSIGGGASFDVAFAAAYETP